MRASLLLVVAGLLAGCRFDTRGVILTRQTEAGSTDRADDRPRERSVFEAGSPDRGHDRLQPDRASPDRPPVDSDGDGIPNNIDFDPSKKASQTHYVAYPGKSSGELLSASPWSTQGDSLCSPSDDGVYRLTQLLPAKLTPTDYTVDSLVRVQNAQLSQDWPGVGVALRVSDITASNLTAYVCAIDLKGRRLVLGRFKQGTYTQFEQAADAGLTGSGPFKLRASAKGGALTCSELVTSTSTPPKNDPALNAGTVGFYTRYAAACFDSLVVTSPP